jgi:hypothetical protein
MNHNQMLPHESLQGSLNVQSAGRTVASPSSAIAIMLSTTTLVAASAINLHRGALVFDRFLILALLSLSALLPAGASAQKIRISAWYWLNAAPKVAWEGDFVTMKKMGFTDVVLCWGIDLAAAGERTADTRTAIEQAYRSGLRSYLVIWQPSANSLKRRPEFQQVDSAGNLLSSFDVFNPQWRNTEWKAYLQTVARAYHDEPGMAGYVFDDSFTLGSVVSGSGHSGTGVISYGKYEQEQFGHPLPKKPADPLWTEWVAAREKWWEDWARDTVSFLREIDRNPQHQIYLEDPADNVLHPERRSGIGLNFAKVASHFDAFGAYSDFAYKGTPEDDVKIVTGTQDILENVTRVVGKQKNSIYTFWVANPTEELVPGPAKLPTVQQIRLIADTALKAGITHLDMYGYRIGDYRVEDLEEVTPGTRRDYPLTRQFSQKFLWDRPGIQDELGKYLRSLNTH